MTTAAEASKVMRLCMVWGDRFQNRFMHAADVFEPAKQLAELTVFKLTLDPSANLEKIIAHFKQTAENMGRNVVAAFFCDTDVGWVDDSVILISNGNMFGPLQAVLDAYGFKRKENHEQGTTVGVAEDAGVAS